MTATWYPPFLRIDNIMVIQFHREISFQVYRWVISPVCCNIISVAHSPFTGFWAVPWLPFHCLMVAWVSLDLEGYCGLKKPSRFLSVEFVNNQEIIHVHDNDTLQAWYLPSPIVALYLSPPFIVPIIFIPLPINVDIIIVEGKSLGFHLHTPMVSVVC